MGVVLDVGLSHLDVVGWRNADTILAVDDGRRLLAIPVAAPSQFTVVAEFPLQLGVDGGYETWSPDLSRVAFLQIVEGEDPGQVYGWDVLVLDVASGTTRHLVREPAMNPFLVWAPDNRTLAYAALIDPGGPNSATVLKVVDAIEGEPVAIANFLTPVAWRPAWR